MPDAQVRKNFVNVGINAAGGHRHRHDAVMLPRNVHHFLNLLHLCQKRHVSRLLFLRRSQRVQFAALFLAQHFQNVPGWHPAQRVETSSGKWSW